MAFSRSTQAKFFLGGAGVGATGRSYLLDPARNESNSGGFIGGRLIVIFDAISEEIITYDSEITKYPAEIGEHITDHVQNSNLSILIKGKMSQTPLDDLSSIVNAATGAFRTLGGNTIFSDPEIRENFLSRSLPRIIGSSLASAIRKPDSLVSQAVNFIKSVNTTILRDILINSRKNKGPFILVTPRKIYQNVVFKSLTFPFNTKTGQALEFEIVLEQIRVIDSSEFSRQKNYSRSSTDVFTYSVNKLFGGFKDTKETNINDDLLRGVVTLPDAGGFDLEIIQNNRDN